MGTDAVYQCKRGNASIIWSRFPTNWKYISMKIRHHMFRMQGEKFNIEITATPVRKWLKAKAIRTKSQKAYRQKQT